MADFLLTAEAERQLSHQNQSSSEVFVLVGSMYLFGVYFLCVALFCPKLDTIKQVNYSYLNYVA